MLFSFLNGKAPNKSYAVFCIDTSSVTLTILEKTSNGEEKISYVARLALELDKVERASDILRLISKRIAEMFKNIAKEKAFGLLKHSTEVFVLVGSPWHIGWNDQVKIEKEEKFTVTDELISTAIHNSFDDAHKDLKITGVHIMGHKLNGYVVSDPVGKISNSLEIKVYISSAPKEFIKTIEENIKTNLPYNKLTFLGYNESINNAVSEVSDGKDCLIIVPENEVTEIILVKNRSIQGEASIPFGSATLARNLFGNKSSGVKESLSKARRFIAGELDVPDLDEIGKKIEAEKQAFLTNFRDALWKMNDSLLLPESLYVVGRNVASHFTLEWLKNEEYTNQTFTINGFNIMNVRGNDILPKRITQGYFSKKIIPFSVAVSLRIIDAVK